MNRKKEKVNVVSYKMASKGFYLLLRLNMELCDRKSINGMSSMMAESKTYEGSEKTLKTLSKDGLISINDNNYYISGGVKHIIDTMLDSPYCMSFTNPRLKKKNKVMSFYWSNGNLAGICVDDKSAHIVMSSEADGVYAAYRKLIEAAGVSDGFSMDKWQALTREKEQLTVKKPKREAMVLHCMNKDKRSRMTVMLLQDSRVLQILRGDDVKGREGLELETVSKDLFYGAVIKELNYLKQSCHNKSSLDKGQDIKNIKPPVTKQKSDYEKITCVKDFPKSVIGFIAWYMLNFIKGIPKMIVSAIKSKAWRLLLYPLFAAVLFFYNMYASCYVNDTFSFSRRAVWKNLTPYLIAGQVQTPSSLYGFDMKQGVVNTTFLVAPLAAVVMLIARNIICQIRTEKAGFLSGIVNFIPKVKHCRTFGHMDKKTVWVLIALSFIGGFIIKNPITIFLIGIFFFLTFIQGRKNGAVMAAFLFLCAKDRKAVEGHKKPEPTIEGASLGAFYIGVGWLVYGAVSLAVWIIFKYSTSMRLIVTLVMAAFCIFQIFINTGSAESRRRNATACILISALLINLQYFITVLADDGGWTESGMSLSGLMENAGFSIRLGITTALIVGAFATTLLPVVIAGGVAAGVPFILSLTDTEAGDYVRKSSHQYFFGPEKGENQTLLCTGTQVAGFVAGFLNPAAGALGNTTKFLKGGKIVGDVVSTIGDSAAAGQDIADYINGDGSISEVMWDVAGLGFDIIGFKGDVEEFADVSKDVARYGDSFRYDDKSLGEQLKDAGSKKQNSLDSLATDMDVKKNDLLSQEAARHDEQIKKIQEEIQDVIDGNKTEFPGGLDKEGYIKVLNESAANEYSIHIQNRDNIKSNINFELENGQKQIIDEYNKEASEIAKDIAKDVPSQAYDAHGVAEGIQSTFGPDTADSPKAPDVQANPAESAIPDSSTTSDNKPEQ